MKSPEQIQQEIIELESEELLVSWGLATTQKRLDQFEHDLYVVKYKLGELRAQLSRLVPVIGCAEH